MRQGQFSNLWKFRKARQVRGEVGWWVNVPELNCNVFPSPRKPKLHTDKEGTPPGDGDAGGSPFGEHI